MINTRKSDSLYCSFCGRWQSGVDALIKGEEACICNECVDECNKVIAEKKNEEDNYDK